MLALAVATSQRSCHQLQCSTLLQLLDTSAVGVRREKMYKLDDHVTCAVAGLTGTGCSTCPELLLNQAHTSVLLQAGMIHVCLCS